MDLKSSCFRVFIMEVTITCGPDTYHVKKDLLIAKSSFFATAFNIDIKEKRDGRIEIHGIKSETLKKVIDYILKNILENKFDITEMLEAANFFNMETLKQDITNAVRSDITTNNVMELANLGEIFNSDTLLKVCAEFIIENENSIMLTRNYVIRNPDLVLMLLAEKEKIMADMVQQFSNRRL